jgi:hypothetical protein
MLRSRLFWLVIAVILVGGLLWGYGRTATETGPPDPFRIWLWTHRNLDLIVQVGLVFAGALGVRAILPGDREEESDLCTWL